MRALRDYFAVSNRYDVTEKLAFSSDRKWGAMEFPELGVIYVGAPERLVAKNNYQKVYCQRKPTGIEY